MIQYKKFVTNIDDLPKDFDETLWVVKLSDGTTIYQSDYLFDTWMELKKKIEHTDVVIEKMWLQFRTHIEEVVVGKIMIFVKGVAFVAGYGSSDLYTVGKEKSDDEVELTLWTVPELTVFEKRVRPKENYESRMIHNVKIPF